MTWQKVVACFAVVFSWPVTGESLLGERRQSQLDGFVENLLECRKLPGVTLALVRDQQVHARGYGFKELRNDTRVTNESMFCIGSLTKGFTATILAMLVGGNENLTWDTPVRDILGQSFHLCDEHRTKYVNIRDLLAHKTGIPGYFGALTTGLDLDMEDIVRRLRFMAPLEKFHSKYLYNNYMYILAGYIAQVLTETPWKLLVHDRLFRPLGMTSSTFVDSVTDWQDFALPHVSIKGELIPLDTEIFKSLKPVGPAGTICSNALDMAKWLKFQMKGGIDARGNRLVAEEEFKELHTPQNPTPMPLGTKLLKQPVFPISEGRFAYDLGWSSGIYRGYHNVQHSGKIFGYDSLIWMFPDNQLGIFSSVNGPMNANSEYALRVLHHFASDLLLNLKPWLNESSACSFPDPWLRKYLQKRRKKRNMVLSNEDEDENEGTSLVREKSITTVVNNARFKRPITDYVGIYGHLAFGNITVTFNQSDKRLYLRHGKIGVAVLIPSDKINTFTMKFLGSLRYISEADGWSDFPIPVVFKGERMGKINALDANFIERKAPPEFRKGILWYQPSTAPNSYNNSFVCDRRTSFITTRSFNSCSQLLPLSVLLTVVTAVLLVK